MTASEMRKMSDNNKLLNAIREIDAHIRNRVLEGKNDTSTEVCNLDPNRDNILGKILDKYYSSDVDINKLVQQHYKQNGFFIETTGRHLYKISW